MPIDVNGYTVADEMLREEATRLAHEYPWRAAPQSTQKAIELFSAAEKNVVNHVLLSEYVLAYPMPLYPSGPPYGTTRVMKGGSYLCHDSYCWRYRNAARTGTSPDSATCHMGFRVVRDI
jgi:formylglycine-generating enzyme required for sulfatase activity